MWNFLFSMYFRRMMFHPFISILQTSNNVKAFLKTVIFTIKYLGKELGLMWEMEK